jgi:hypothetical protein
VKVFFGRNHAFYRLGVAAPVYWPLGRHTSISLTEPAQEYFCLGSPALSTVLCIRFLGDWKPSSPGQL